MNLRKRFAMLPEAGVTENHFMTRAEMTAGVGCAVSVSTLAAVVGPHGVARVRHGSDEGTPASRRHRLGVFGGPRARRSLAGPGDGHDELPLAVCGTPRGSRAREVTTGGGRQRLRRRCSALDLRQATAVRARHATLPGSAC